MPVARARILRREAEAAARIPYRAHVGPQVVRSALGDYVQVFQLQGASFETADDAQLNAWHERLNVLWRSVAAPDVALWTHVIRRHTGVVAPAAAASQSVTDTFGDSLMRRYRAGLGGDRLMANDLYLAVVHRPMSGIGGGVLAELLRRRGPSAAEEVTAALEACDKLARTVQSALERYEPRALGVYKAGGRVYSGLLEFFALLINGEWQPVPLPRAALHDVLATTRVGFGTEVIEYRLPTRTRLGAMLGIKEYATPVVVGLYNRLLSAPFPYVLTQSFAFLTKAAAQGLLIRQINRMANAGDFAISQAAQLRSALDSLTAGEFVMGDHHFSLQVMAEPAIGMHRLERLEEHLALARSLLTDTGMIVAREDLALEAAFWAQLPGNFPMRPRKAPITSRNFAAMSGLHNYPVGRAAGNHWGDALTVFVTSAGSPYHFSLHASDPTEPNGGARRDTGHTFICGPTGSGKTVFIGFLIAALAASGTTQIVFDKDRGLEILVRAMDGEYLPLTSGVPTGCNPLQLPINPQNVEFLKNWLALLARRGSGAGLTVREQADLDQALAGTLALETGARRLSRLIEFLDPTDPEGVHARLAHWCGSTRGDYAWVFDNATDSIVPRLGTRSLIGFDVTQFLDHAGIRNPLTFYLFHLIRSLLDGRRMVCWLDEFWRLLADPAFESFAKDGPKTWRKLNAVMCVATQSASDVLDSPISRTIVEQTPTKIFFPNPDASFAEYGDGLGLSEREFRLIKERLTPGSRSFLVKQGHQSIVCRLELTGFESELRVISGRAAEVERMRALMARYGAQSRHWLPFFLDPTASRS
jgi:type IV secretion system protein VirB4